MIRHTLVGLLIAATPLMLRWLSLIVDIFAIAS